MASGPISQPLAYHRYADARTIAGIPNFWNVVSNLPFAIIGLSGLFWATRPRQRGLLARAGDLQLWVVLFAGEVLTGFGSAYYHAAPTNRTLVWDRLAFSLVLTSFFAIAVSELVRPRVGQRLLMPLVATGLASVLYWHWTDDLRPYALVQFVPVALVPILALLSRGRLVPSSYFLSAWLLYAAAKVCEMQDAAIYDITGVWSGHTLKHLLAGVAAAAPLLGLARSRYFLKKTSAPG